MANIKRDIVITGALNRFEVWAQEDYGRYEEETSQLYEKLAEDLVDMGLKGSL